MKRSQIIRICVLALVMALSLSLCAYAAQPVKNISGLMMVQQNGVQPNLSQHLAMLGSRYCLDRTAEGDELTLNSVLNGQLGCLNYAPQDEDALLAAVTGLQRGLDDISALAALNLMQMNNPEFEMDDETWADFWLKVASGDTAAINALLQQGYGDEETHFSAFPLNGGDAVSAEIPEMDGTTTGVFAGPSDDGNGYLMGMTNGVDAIIGYGYSFGVDGEGEQLFQYAADVSADVNRIYINDRPDVITIMPNGDVYALSEGVAGIAAVDANGNLLGTVKCRVDADGNATISNGIVITANGAPVGTAMRLKVNNGVQLNVEELTGEVPGTSDTAAQQLAPDNLGELMMQYAKNNVLLQAAMPMLTGTNPTPAMQ